MSREPSHTDVYVPPAREQRHVSYTFTCLGCQLTQVTLHLVAPEGPGTTDGRSDWTCPCGTSQRIYMQANALGIQCTSHQRWARGTVEETHHVRYT